LQRGKLSLLLAVFSGIFVRHSTVLYTVILSVEVFNFYVKLIHYRFAARILEAVIGKKWKVYSKFGGRFFL